MTTRPPLRQRKKAKTREAIISAASKLFSSQGFDATTLDQIADLAEVHKQTVFRYFPSKQSIALARNIELLEIFERDVQSPERKGSVVEYWREYIEFTSNFFKPYTSEVRRFQELVLESPTLQAHHLEIHRRLESGLVTALAKEAGRDPRTDLYAICLGSMLVAMNRIIYAEVVRGELKKPLDEASLEAMDFVEKIFPSRSAAEAASPASFAEAPSKVARAALKKKRVSRSVAKSPRKASPRSR